MIESSAPAGTILLEAYRRLVLKNIKYYTPQHVLDAIKEAAKNG